MVEVIYDLINLLLMHLIYCSEEFTFVAAFVFVVMILQVCILKYGSQVGGLLIGLKLLLLANQLDYSSATEVIGI